MSLGQELASNSNKTGVLSNCPRPESVYEGPNSFDNHHQLGCHNNVSPECRKCIFNSKPGQETFYFTLKNGRYTLAD